LGVLGFGFGVWGLGDWGLAQIPNPQSPSPIYILISKLKNLFYIFNNENLIKIKKKLINLN